MRYLPLYEVNATTSLLPAFLGLELLRRRWRQWSTRGKAQCKLGRALLYHFSDRYFFAISKYFSFLSCAIFSKSLGIIESL